MWRQRYGYTLLKWRQHNGYTLFMW